MLLDAVDELHDWACCDSAAKGLSCANRDISALKRSSRVACSSVSLAVYCNLAAGVACRVFAPSLTDIVATIR